MVALSAQRDGTVIDVQDDAVEAAPRFAYYIRDILLQNDHSRIGHGIRGKIEGRVAIPCDDRSQDLSHDHRGVGGKRGQSRFQCEAESQPADQDARATDNRPMAGPS